MLGWHVVVAKKDNLKIGDMVVYCEVDSVLPARPEFEFLRQRHFRIKTIKLRGQISQGIVFPLDILPKGTYPEGYDVTEILGIVKWEPYEEPIKIPTQYSKDMWPKWLPKRIVMLLKRYSWFRKYFMKKALTWPQFLQKTDEDRVQICGKLLHENTGKMFYYTEKVDGSSITVFNYNKHIGVCSRNLELPDSGNNYWETAKKLGLTTKIPDGFAIQGELVGPGIQKNKYKLAEFDIYVFSVYNIKERRYLKYADFLKFTEALNIKTVPIIGTMAMITDIDELVNLATDKSRLEPCTYREGLVFRNLDDSHISFKAINPLFLLKFDE